MSADLQERMLAAVAEAAQRNAVIASTIAVAEPTELTEFERRALPLITKNVPVVPLRPRTKIAFFDAWQNIATTDAAKIAQWGHDYPDANIASVAKAQPGGVWFLDVDREGFAKQIEQQTGHKMPETFMVRSSASKGHYYFLQSAASIAMGNRQGKGDDGKETFSARVSDRYVVGPNSYHPDGHTYELLKDVAIVEAPQWLIDFCVANDAKTEIKKTEHTENEPVHEGGRNNLLTSIAGKMRQLGKLDKEELYQYLTSQNLKRCVPPLPDSEVRTIANSIGNYAITVAPPVIYQGRNLSEQPAQAAVAAAQIEPAKINSIPYPKFPLAGWIFEGIPAYDKWVKPFCKINSRYPEFMMLPLMVLILNYLSAQQVRIEYKNFPLSIYLLLVGRKGRVIKSSSAQDAMSFCEMMGILRQHGTATRNADGKSLVFTVGSTEGLGSEMTRTVCKGAVLFYDEFSKLIAKMGIENSSFANDLSTMYESGKFANRTKSHKEAFSFEPGTYCTSLIGCTTDKRYPRLASKLFSSVDGMDERFFVLYQPEVLKDVEPMTDVPIPADAVLETRKLIDKAVDFKSYQIDDSEPLRQISKINNRLEIRAEKWALAFAVLLGRDSVDETCVERGIALAKYEHAVKQFLQVGESITREGGLQREIRLIIERAGGKMKLRDLQRKANYDDYGTELWYRVYGGLTRGGIIAETGTGVHGDPKTVTVIVPIMRDSEEE